MKFQRSIGSIALLFSALGGIVGSGWLFGPLYAAQVAGPAAILSWMIGGLLMISIALTFAELATAFPIAGGMVRFAEFSHGPMMSFTVGWMVWLSSVVVAPVETLALIQYTANYFPALVHKVAGTTVLTGGGVVASAIVMLVMCILNIQGAKFFSRAGTAIVSIKLIVPAITLVTLLLLDFHPSNLEAAGGFFPYGWQGVFSALPLGGVIFSFIGYSTAIQLAGEAKNPQRAIPFAIIGALVFCIFLYVLLQLAFVGALKPEYLTQGWHNLNFAGDSGPFAGILTALGAIWLVIIIYGDAVISPFGTGFIYTASTARVNYALSEIGFFPKFFKQLNKNGIPASAIAVNYIVGLFLFLPFPGWQSMVTFIISCFVIAYSIGPIALITLRRTYPNQIRPFLLPYVDVIAFIAFYICNLLIFWTGWHTVSRLMMALGVGLLVFVYRYFKLKNQGIDVQWKKSIWLIPYFIGVGVISYLGSFGHGINVIKFGVDFFVIALFSGGIFYFALQSAKKMTPTDQVVKI